MKKSAIIGIVAAVVVILIVGGFLINNTFKKNAEDVNIGGGSSNDGTEDGTAAQEDNFQGNTQYIDITSTGLAAARYEIFKGDRVVWRNKDTNPHWIASNLHPGHALYPESGGCKGSKFDSCGPIKPGESWSFIFTKEGTWGYHDDYNLKNAGEIVVKVKQNLAS